MPDPSDATNIIDLNPYLLAIELVLDILEWTGVIPDPISLLIQLFEGKPREQDTITVAQRLFNSHNVAGRLWGIQILRLLRDFDIVLSSSDAFGQMMEGQIRAQFKANMIAQGVTSQRAGAIVDNIMFQTTGPDQPVPLELRQVIDPNLAINGDQAIKDLYNQGYELGQQKGLTGDKLEIFAEHYIFRHATFKQLKTLAIGKPVQPPPPPPPPPPPGPIGGQGGGGDELTDCCQNLSNAVAQLGQTLLQLLSGQGGQGGPAPGPTTDCCDQVVTSIDGVAAQLQQIVQLLPAPAAGSGGSVDLSPVVTALKDLKAALTPVSVESPALNSTLQDRLTAIADAIGKNPPTDVSGIVKELHQANLDADVPQGIIDQLIAEGAVSKEVGQLISGAPWERVLSGALGSIAKFLGGELGDIEHGLGKLIQNLGEPAAGALWAAIQDFVRFANSQTGDAWAYLQKVLNDWNAKVVRDAGPRASNLQLLGTGLEDLFSLLTEYTFGELAELFFKLVRDPLVRAGAASPETFTDAAQVAYGNAFASGMIAHFVAILLDGLYVTKQTGLPALAAAIAELAGFAEISKAQLAPYYDAAIRTQARYDANAKLKPEYPAEFDATLWRSRQLISEDDLKEVFKYSPLKSKYEPAYLASAFRAVSPFILSRAAETGAISNSDLADVLTFGGYRPVDQGRLLAAFNEAAIDPYKKQALSAMLTAAERGTISGADIDAALDSLDILAAARPFIKLTIAYRRLEQLDTLYRKSISEGYQYGSISDQEYVAAMENAGINEADAQAHYAVDSIKKHGREAMAAQREAAKLANAQQRAAVRAAEAEFFAGNLDALGLSAAVLGAGVDPTVATYTVAMATARKQIRNRWTYGLELPPDKAALLREQVAAIKEQTTKKLITPDQAIAQLASLNIPGPERENLVASWAAQAYKEILPIGQ